MLQTIRSILLALSLLCLLQPASHAADSTLNRRISDYVEKSMQEAHIPGLSLVLVSEGRARIYCYGRADLQTGQAVNPATLFQLGSCSKAFTALALLRLEQQGKVKPDEPVSAYIPWLRFIYKQQQVPVTINQLLHHSSGIPWTSISKIPEDSSPAALENTIRLLNGQLLSNAPGHTYEYATVNYDILALVIQYVSHQRFETYVQQQVLAPLSLSGTNIGIPQSGYPVATGYKMGFFRPQAFSAPVFAGNNAAGYIISNATDIAQWLLFQMGLKPDSLYSLAQTSHQRDESVPLHNMSSYAMGWDVSLDGTGEISHSGLNPNFTSYIGFRPGNKTGVAILVNSNSHFTSIIGANVLKMLSGNVLVREFDTDDNSDRVFTMITLLMSVYSLVVIALMITMLVDIARKKRVYQKLSPARLGNFLLAVLAIVPLLYGMYLLPHAMGAFSWKAALVWLPESLVAAVALVLLAIALSYAAYFTGLVFPQPHAFKKMAPRILLMSIVSGVANMLLIILISSSLSSNVPLKYLLFYYVLMFSVYFLGRRFVQISLIKFSRGIVYQLRLKLFDKIFATSYQKFEKIDIGRIYTALNEDVGTIGESTNMTVTLITSVFTAVGAFLYLASIAFWATVLTLLLIGTLSGIYYFVSRSTNIYFEQARDTRNVFVRLTSGMIEGFKELSMHRNKKLAYKQDISDAANEYKERISKALIRFVNASLTGESLLIVLLGAVAFAIPKAFPGIQPAKLMSFVIVLLYLIGPINSILSSVPAVLQLKIAWKRIQQFLKEIPANLELQELAPPPVSVVESLEVCAVRFRHETLNGQAGFGIGPVELKVRRGEILFIIGGNGSGKTTLAKLLTGLYTPDEGFVKINGKVVEAGRLSEYYSAVFSPFCLFEKLYNIDCESKSEVIKKYLKLLDLDEKVTIRDNRYSTIKLSGGQRKRLALLQCYLEDSPVYLFDEWAADQDPGYRHFFYRTLLPDMKKAGKIVIAITHDDHYFDVADKVLKMNHGKLETYITNKLNDTTVYEISQNFN